MTPVATTLGDAELDVGDSTLTGTLIWSQETGEEPRTLAANLATPSFDLDQLRAVADLFIGENGNAESGTAQSYDIRLAADQLLAGDVAIGNVALDVGLTANAITVNDLTIGDLDGGTIAANGTISDWTSDTPRGTLTATLQADQLDGVVALAEHVAPNADFTAWLARSAPALGPIDIQAAVAAQNPGSTGYSINVAGTAGGTSLRLDLTTDGRPSDWANSNAGFEVEIDAADGAELLRQVGLTDTAMDNAGPATIDVSANGVPSEGMAAHLTATVAGVLIASDGTLTLAEGADPTFAGPITAQGDLDPLARLFGFVLPNSGTPTPAVLEAQLSVDGPVATIDLRPSSVDERSVDGTLQVTADDGVWDVTGQLNLEELDLGWLATWPLGMDPLPAGGTEEPWSTDLITGALMNNIALDVDVSADRFVLGDSLTITNADVGFTFGDEQAHIDLRNGSLSTGLVRSSLSLAFQDGQIVLDGQLFLADVPMAALAWRSDGQPVADGVVGLSAEFGAIGRSPAGLISTLAGSGSLEISQGVFHFMGADAFDLIIRYADEGDAITEDQLRDTFTGFLDAGTLDFGDATVRFDIAAGIVTPDPIINEAGPVQVVIRGPVDLTHLTLDSSWELTQTEGRGTSDGPQPRAYVTFTGPIAAPVRQVNVAPLAGYLSLRRLRETEQLQADVLERERFIRLIDQIQAERAAAAAAEPTPAAEPAPAPAEAAPTSRCAFGGFGAGKRAACHPAGDSTVRWLACRLCAAAKPGKHEQPGRRRKAGLRGTRAIDLSEQSRNASTFGGGDLPQRVPEGLLERDGRAMAGDGDRPLDDGGMRRRSGKASSPVVMMRPAA